MANASAEVNLVRCDRTGALAAALRARGMVNQTSRLDLIQAHLDSDPVARGKLGAPPDAILVNVFVTSQAGLPAESLPPLGRALSRMHVATVPLSSLRTLADHPMVMNIAMGQTLKAPQVTVSTDRPNGRPSRQSLGSPAGHRDGADVLVGVIDIGGFDFSHPDILDGHGGTRFLSIWDMGADPHDIAPEAGVGRLITQEQMNAALAAAVKAGAPATRLEPQSAMHPGSHGTHVASISAGNSGIAPKAGILCVLIALPQSDWDARSSFFDSTRLALAVRWLTDTARQMGRPIAINISLGTNGHAHDSSVAVNRWIDMLLSEPGRCVCVAAGNGGQEKSAGPGDMGDVMGRIHTSGRIAARGLDHDIRWVVVGNSRVDVSDNELELWFSAQDRLAVSLRTPAGQWLGPLEPNEFIENRQLPDGSSVSIYNELYHLANGANTIAVYLKNGLGANAVNSIPAGTWTARLHGREIRDGQFHGWIERDDPQPRGSVGPSRKLWSFPSYFSPRMWTATRSARWPAACVSSRWPTWTPPPSASASAAVRDRPATGGKSPMWRHPALALWRRAALPATMICGSRCREPARPAPMYAACPPCCWVCGPRSPQSRSWTFCSAPRVRCPEPTSDGAMMPDSAVSIRAPRWRRPAS
ncbi:MAG: S8 family serine peptidase [Burkholderiaceae bacterium]|nr:S8 family serine peptidase [Burkholderiaceae bacterium]